MRSFAADLHIHTALSPCASEEMTPPAIVAAAIEKALAMIAICDHNSAGNVAAVREAAGRRMAVIPGIEAATAEEVHVLGLFPDTRAASAAAHEIAETLPDAGGGSRKFGEQRLMDARGRVVGTEKKMLSAASSFSLSQTVALIRRHGGLAIASHVDRPSFSVISQLGMLPQDAGFDALEVSPPGVASGKAKDYAGMGLPLVASSDSHFLADIGACRTRLEMRRATFDELALALKGAGGRRCAFA